MNGSASSLPLPAWFLQWLSVDTAALEGGEAHLKFARFPDGELGLLALLGVVAALGLVALTYYREGNLPTWRKCALAAWRCLLVLVMALILFYPILEVNRAQDLRAVSLVLLDDSLSMGIRDRYLGAVPEKKAIATALSLEEDDVERHSRADLVLRALRDEDLEILERLRRKNLVEIYTFSDELRRLTSTAADGGGDVSLEAPESAAPSSASDGSAPASTTDGEISAAAIALEPRGTVTDLAGALRGAIEQQGGTRVAGVIVVTDGRVTAGEGISGAADLLRRKDVPVHAVGVGDPTAPRNLRVTAVLASERVFVGDPITVDVRVAQKGFDGETVQVELVDVLEDGSRAARSLPASEVTFEDGQGEALTSFRVAVEGLGRHRLVARIAPRSDEIFSDDNERSAVVEVVEEASKVLLIAGGPSFEYRFLKNLLRRDRRVHVAGWLMSADPNYPQEGNVSLKKLPSESQQLFEYDVVVLIDVDPAGLPGGFADLMERFVGKHRGGLLYVAGETHGVKFFRSRLMAPVRDMLPVVPDLVRAEAEGGGEVFHSRAWPLVPTASASMHPPTRLSSRLERNRDRWAEIGGFYWSFPISKVKPGATVLLEHGDPARAIAGRPQPVIAWQYYAGGRTMFIGSDETWSWRAASEEVYDQFWVQTIRFLTETRLAGARRQILQTESDAYELGDVMRISSLLLDENYNPRTDAFRQATVESPDGSIAEVRLESDETAPGWYRGVFMPRTVGEYRIRLADGGERVVRVDPPDLEFQEPRLDAATLRDLASRTGGSYLPLEEIAAAGDLIADRRQTIITTDEPIPLWDNWFSLSLLAGLLTIEWVLRKLSRLL